MKKTCLGVAIGLLISGVGFAQTNLRFGTWKLDVANSKYAPGPPPKSETRIYTASGADRVTLKTETIAADGTKHVSGYTAKYDGKDYPYEGATGDTIALTSTDPYSVDAVVKKNAKVVQTTHGVISKDGKTMTMTTKSTTPDGKPASNTRVYRKQ